MAKWDGEALALARLAATRDLLLGAWLAAELKDGGKPLAPAVALTACDAGDALTFALLAGRGGDAVKTRPPRHRSRRPSDRVGAWLVSRLK